MNAQQTGRANQKARTRQAIVRAAGALLACGRKPSLDEIAATAGVSRATAYRYFPGLDALLSEAAVDLLVPAPEQLLDSEAPSDPSTRLALVDEAMDRACRERDVALRLMLARTLERSICGDGVEAPLRQNRRVPLIERAIAPLSGKLGSKTRTRLVQALAMVVGTEGYIALSDVVGLDREEAGEVRRWAMNALLQAAQRES